jgi:hypothetical protein
METSLDLIVLYTCDLRGDLDRLPRLFTLIRGLMDAPYQARHLLLDLGNACGPEVWHCEATGGRSTLMVLDAMGYHAANVTGVLSEENRARIAAVTTMALVDADHPHLDADILITSEVDIQSSCFQICLTPHDETRVAVNTLFLARVEAGRVGMAMVRRTPDGTAYLHSHEVPGYDLHPRIHPDPTIAGTVDFVLSEARVYQRKQR